jgi:hypothetical protein
MRQAVVTNSSTSMPGYTFLDYLDPNAETQVDGFQYEGNVFHDCMVYELSVTQEIYTYVQDLVFRRKYMTDMNTDRVGVQHLHRPGVCTNLHSTVSNRCQL